MLAGFAAADPPLISDRDLGSTRVISRGRRVQSPNPELLKAPEELPGAPLRVSVLWLSIAAALTA